MHDDAPELRSIVPKIRATSPAMPRSIALRPTHLVARAAAIIGALAAVGVAATVGATLGPGAAQRAAASAALASTGSSPVCRLPARVAKDRVVVAVVVDFGGAGGRVVVSCVLVKPGASDAQALQVQAAVLGYSPPRYAESGLLCAIGGYPASGCGTQSGGHYAYWSYWHGGKRWQYANGGPAEWKVARGDVEGWRFQPDGSATPADPAPRAASSAAALEMPASATQTTTSPPSSGRAGPVRPSGNKGPDLSPFIVGTGLILLIGAGALLRARRAGDRVS